MCWQSDPVPDPRLQGCGIAEVAQAVPNIVHSFDLVAHNECGNFDIIYLWPLSIYRRCLRALPPHTRMMCSAKWPCLLDADR